MGRTVLVLQVCFGVLMVLFALTRVIWINALILVAGGACMVMVFAMLMSLVQLTAPNELRGRVMSIWGLTFSLIPTGGAISGAVAEQFGVPLAMVLGGIAVVATTLTVAARLPRIRQLRNDSLLVPGGAGAA